MSARCGQISSALCGHQLPGRLSDLSAQRPVRGRLCILAEIVSIGHQRLRNVYDPTCGSGSLLLRAANIGNAVDIYGPVSYTHLYNTYLLMSYEFLPYVAERAFLHYFAD